jgi:hypothetical protein
MRAVRRNAATIEPAAIVARRGIDPARRTAAGGGHDLPWLRAESPGYA